MTPAAPPSAERVWLRRGWTFETTATFRLGLISDTAMAARRPAPPPPTKRTSWVVTSIRTNPELSGRLAKREPAAAKQAPMYFSTGEKSREGNAPQNSHNEAHHHLEGDSAVCG